MSDIYTTSRNVFQGQPQGRKEMICTRCNGNFSGDASNEFNDGQRNVILCDNCKRELGHA